MAYAKYRSNSEKGWPAASYFKWKLYVVQAAFWSDCISFCLISVLKNRYLSSSGKAEPSHPAPLSPHSLNSSLFTCSHTSYWIMNISLSLLFFFVCVCVKAEKNMHFWRQSFSDSHDTGCFIHRYHHCAELQHAPFLVQCLLRWSMGMVGKGCQSMFTKTLIGGFWSFINS